MYALPPPGRWRQVCNELFELKPGAYVPPSRRGALCPACEGTGWRAAEDGSGVLPCECRTGGVPPHVELSTLQAPMRTDLRALPALDDELPPVEGETELARRRREWGNVILHCACCGQPYRRRSGWRCCAPPPGMRFDRWAAQWHRNCAGPNQNRCPQHCQHPLADRGLPTTAAGFFPMPAAGEHVKDWAVRTGLRDANAPDTPPDPLGESEWVSEPSPEKDDDLGF